MATSISAKGTKRYLLRFALPTIISMLLMSTFGIIDGIFVSRLIDPIALSAVGIVFPFLSFAMAIGFMLGVGGNALIAKKIGEGLLEQARVNFTFVTLVAFLVSLVISAVGIISPDLILRILGADDFVYFMAYEYMMPLLYFLPTVVLGMVFQQFLITEGKAHISAIVAFIGGILSAGLNFLFIYILEMGLRGAALATSIGYTLPAIVGLINFTFMRKGNLYFVKPKFDLRVLGRVCINGASEMVTLLSTSITAVLMNNVLIRIQGPEAISAAGIMFAGMGILAALFSGYSSGIAPIISYNYGKGDIENLRLVFRNSMRLIGVISILCVVLGWLLTDTLISVYNVPVGSAIHDMAFLGFRLLAVCFVFMGFNVFTSMMFTALNNGLVSSLLSFFRTLVFFVVSFLLLTEFFGLTGAWLAIPVAELLGIAMTIFFIKRMKSVYKYA